MNWQRTFHPDTEWRALRPSATSAAARPSSGEILTPLPKCHVVGQVSPPRARFSASFLGTTSGACAFVPPGRLEPRPREVAHDAPRCVEHHLGVFGRGRLEQDRWYFE